MEDLLSRKEHIEFAKRMEDEHRRQNERIETLEYRQKQITELTVSVKELALSVKQLGITQKEQLDKLEKLEGRDGEKWRKVVGYVITTVIGIMVGYIFKQLGI